MSTSQSYWLPVNAHILPYDNTAWGKGVPRGANYQGYPGTGAGGAEHYFTRDATIGFSESIDQSEGVFGYTYYLRLGVDNVSTSHTTITGQPIKGMALGLGGNGPIICLNNLAGWYVADWLDEAGDITLVSNVGITLAPGRLY